MKHDTASIKKTIFVTIQQGGDSVLLPYLSEVQSTSKKYTVTFRGLNYGEGTQDGEFAETYNLSTDNYPCITQRAARVMTGKYTKPSTLHSKGKLLVIDGTDVFYGDTKVGEVTAGKKQTATIGNYIVIFPDKKYYKVPTETEPDGEFGDMDIKYEMKGLKFTSSTISLVNEYKATGLNFTNFSISTYVIFTAVGLSFTTDSIKGNYKFPFKSGDMVTITGCSDDRHNKTTEVQITSVQDGVLNFSAGTFAIAGTENGAVRITRNGKNKLPFKAGDTVTITGCSKSENNKELVIKSATDDRISFDSGTFTETIEDGEVTITRTVDGFPFGKGDSVTIEGCSSNGNNYEEEIIIRGATKEELTFDANTFTAVDNETNNVIIRRTVPPLDFVCESNYRLWGTHGNTIYSSAWNDPLNFKSFEGLTGDSYAIDVGSDGEFTGCIPYASHICFFKENTLHKLYGTKPSNFQIATVNVYGVQSGSERSMQIVNEQLLYKGVGGVYAYTGGVPELISEKFGNRRYSDAVACCDGEKYYISMKQGDTYSMFAYDVAKNIWLREDDTNAVDMTFYEGKVYFLDSRGGLYYIDKTADRNDIEWGATFCTIHETMNERKGYSKFHLRMDLSAGAWLAVDIKTDNDLKWQQVYTTHNEKAKTVSIPIMPTRCDSIDIRLRGKGKCTVKTFIREFSVGSDV